MLGIKMRRGFLRKKCSKHYANCLKRPYIFELPQVAVDPVAQWIARRTSNPEAVGSSPTGVVNLLLLCFDRGDSVINVTWANRSSLIFDQNRRDRKHFWARPGFEPGTSRTRSANHTPRPTSLRSKQANKIKDFKERRQAHIFSPQKNAKTHENEPGSSGI